MSSARTVQARYRRGSSFPVQIELLESRLVPGSILSLAGTAFTALALGRLTALETAAPGRTVSAQPWHPLSSGFDPHATLGPTTRLLSRLDDPEHARLLVVARSHDSLGAHLQTVSPSDSTQDAAFQAQVDVLFAAWHVDPLREGDVFAARRREQGQRHRTEFADGGAGAAPGADAGQSLGRPTLGEVLSAETAGAEAPGGSLSTVRQATLEGVASPPPAGGGGQGPSTQDVRCPDLRPVDVEAGDSDGEESLDVLADGQDYTLISSGQVVIGDDPGTPGDQEGFVADTEYYWEEENEESEAVDGEVTLEVAGAALHEEAPPAPPYWGPYRDNHEYYLWVVGEGDEINLTFVDSSYGDNSGVLHVQILCGLQNIPPVPPGNCCACALGPIATPGLTLAGNAPGCLSSGEVRYSDGVVSLASTDLASDSFGSSWGLTRSWTNDPAKAPNSSFGAGTIVAELPYLVKYRTTTANTYSVVAVSDGMTGRYFDTANDVDFTPRHFLQEDLSHDSGNKEFVLIDTLGGKLKFHSFDGTLPAYERGQLKSHTDASGLVTTVSRDSDGRVTEVYRETGSGSSTVRDSYLYSSITSGPVRGMVQNVVLRRGTGSPLTYTTVREASYSYYTPTPSSEYFGPTGTLKLVLIKDSSGAVIDTEYYRYWKPGDTDFSTKGYYGGVKYVFRSAAYARILQAGVDPLTASDSTVAPYADLYFEYGTAHSVTKQKIAGAGCSQGTGCSEGLGEYTFTYTVTDRSNYVDGYNYWRVKTVETRPDGGVYTVYTNFAGQVMLTDLTISADHWVDFYKYDASGRLLWHANPSAVEKDGQGKYYDDANADLMGEVSGDYTYLYDGQGLIEVTDYSASTSSGISESVAGNVAGYQANTWLRRGDTGSDVKQSTTQYYKRTANSSDVFPVATETRYRNTDGTGGQTTTYAYTWFSGTAEVESETVTLPTVTTAQNGPNAAVSAVTFNDTFGRPIWTKDGDGYITYTEYDSVTGAVAKTIADVDTTTTSNEPSGWSTPSGGGLHLTSQFVVDALGRTTKVTEPNGNVSHTVYLDAATDEIQTVQLTGSPTGGTFTLSFRSQTTSAIAYNATPATVESALEALSTIGTDNVSVTTAAGGGWDVRFRNVLGGQDVSALTGSGASLTGGTSPAVSVTTATAGGGPVHQVRTYPGWDTTSQGCSTSTPCTTGPIQISRENRFQSYSESLTLAATPAVSGGNPTGQEAITLSAIKTLSRTHTNKGGQASKQESYFDLSAGVSSFSESATFGTLDTNFARTTDDYDKGGRQNKSVTAVGTITRTVFDVLGRTVSSWVGTNDTSATDADPTGGSASGNNMVKVSDNVYDGATATPGTARVGDSNLTQTALYPGGGEPSRVTQHFYDWRNRSVATKGGVQASETDTAVQRPISYTTYDNLGQATAQETFDGDGISLEDSSGVAIISSTYNPDRRRTLTESLYDEQGRTYRTTVYNISQSTGAIVTFGSSVQSRLQSDTWYNKRGQVIKTTQPGGLVQKTTYDGAGRTLKSYATDGGSDPAPGATSNWDHADDVTGDAVLSQSEPTYDSNGNVIKTILRERFHDETTTGELNDPSNAPKARVSYSGSWYDAANRMTASATVGTNEGSAWTRPSAAPSRDDENLVTSQTYNTSGWVQDVTDPRGIVRRTEYDVAGRTTKTIDNYLDGTPSATDDRTTEYTYDSAGHVLTHKAVLPSSGQQTTQYVYGATTTDSDLNSNELLVTVKHPDKSTGAPSTDSTQQESYTYNALGEPKKAHYDRNGNYHVYVYDVVGRQTHDALVVLGTGVDGAVLMLETGYDTAGRPYRFTSYDDFDEGVVVNEVQRVYNGFGQLITEYQEHSGAVNTGSTPKVQYAYSEANNGSNEYVNHSRLKCLTYPDGRVLNYGYGTGGGLNDTISRLASLTNSSTTYEQYAYLGLGTVVKRGRLQGSNEIGLTYIKQSGESNGDAGDPYTGLDRFGRVVDQRWLKDDDASNPKDRFQYGYDRNGNRLYRDNLLSNSFDELYHANGASAGYDNFNQLLHFRRGTLSDSNSDNILDTVSTAGYYQRWTDGSDVSTLDVQGNWDSVTTYDGTNTTTETRTHNKQNQVATVSNQTNPAYDNNGAMTTDQTDKRLKYDGWGRLVEVKSAGGSSVLVSYSYDALNRRITETADSVTKDFYYSEQWQVLEERHDGDVKVQYVWSPVYVDALVLRDRDTGGDPDLDERLYVQQDANWNVTAVTTPGGTVQERYVYEPYGKPFFLDGSWGSLSGSAYAWVYLHQGGRYEAATGLYHFRHRELSAALGRWNRQDPLGFQAGDTNLYRYLRNSPASSADPTGLVKVQPPSYITTKTLAERDSRFTPQTPHQNAGKFWAAHITRGQGLISYYKNKDLTQPYPPADKFASSVYGGGDRAISRFLGGWTDGNEYHGRFAIELDMCEDEAVGGPLTSVNVKEDEKRMVYRNNNWETELMWGADPWSQDFTPPRLSKNKGAQHQLLIADLAKPYRGNDGLTYNRSLVVVDMPGSRKNDLLLRKSEIKATMTLRDRVGRPFAFTYLIKVGVMDPRMPYAVTTTVGELRP